MLLKRRLNNSLPTIRPIAATFYILSCFFLYNSLGLVAKLIQVIEVLLNLSLVNSNLGTMTDNLIELLRAFKFPLKLPSRLFWPDYKQASGRLFWKWRFKITKHEKQLFILCNETLIVIVYLLVWISWLVLFCKEACSRELDQSQVKEVKVVEKRKKDNGLGRKEERITSQIMRLRKITGERRERLRYERRSKRKKEVKEELEIEESQRKRMIPHLETQENGTGTRTTTQCDEKNVSLEMRTRPKNFESGRSRLTIQVRKVKELLFNFGL